ncbi:MAG TPA: pyruvate, water dikinase regulatory protein [Legionellaceae bacterium]|nr:pyruvate, water dikinase regulatory protein [Legionellaceae bacterium]
MKRMVYMISDGTGLTVESLSNSLISQFETIHFEKKVFPFVDSIPKIEAICNEIKQYEATSSQKPLVFMTLVDAEIGAYLKNTSACVFDLFATFLGPLEDELGIKASDTVGRTHAADNDRYEQRIDAVNYALAYDDGIKIHGYELADIILIGVSRCGKTPTCLYMALQFGIFAANYPFTLDELSSFQLPSALQPFRSKLFGLTIDPIRLQSIRSERRPNTPYASFEQCRQEVSEIEQLYHREKIPFLDSTHFSIEEIATKILATAKIKRRL